MTKQDDLNNQNIKDGHDCISTIFKILLIFILIMIGISTCNKAFGQQWKNENRGLYPNSVQLTFNVPNEMVGITYGYLFQQPVFYMPLGVYGEYVSTIPYGWHSPNYFKYNNYDWQHKYSLGLSIALPTSFEAGQTHAMATIGINYYETPVASPDHGLRPGQYASEDWLRVSTIGCDLGVKIQLHHFTMHLKTDIVNWMRYTQFGAGYTFSYRKG